MENDMDVFGELIKHEPGLLSRPIEELGAISFIGAAAVAGYRSLISRLDSLPMTEEQKAKTLKDGQEAGTMLLAIEGRIGELLPQDARSVRIGSTKPVLPDSLGKTPDQRHNASQNARMIAANPDVVAEIIAEAEENEDIPTKTAVLNKVRLNKETERRKKAEKRNKDKPKALISVEEEQYINGLDKAIAAIPTVPPKDWHDEPLRQARAKARIIMGRLGVFDE